MKLLAGIAQGQPLLLGLAIIGCATAGLLTGHLTAADWGTTIGLTVGGGAIVGTAHVVGTQVNTAAGSPPPSSPPPPSGSVGTV